MGDGRPGSPMGDDRPTHGDDRPTLTGDRAVDVRRGLGDDGAAGAAGAPGPGTRHPADERVVHQMERAISLLLRGGVLVSTGLMLAGLILIFVHHPGYSRLSGGVPYRAVTSPSVPAPHTFSELGNALASDQGRGLVVVGLVVLILTPVLRVVVGMLGFARLRDLPMALVTLGVLCVLVASFFVGSR